MARRVLIFSQVYPPDPAAVGQQLADAAAELARRGHEVVAFTSDRGYDDLSVRYPRREIMNGVAVKRLSGTSFGKTTLLRRIAAGVSFMTQAFWIVLTTRRIAGIVFSTAPPMIGVVMTLAAAIRRVPVLYWVMDLNPDQLVALGRLAPNSLAARFLDALGRLVLRRADRIVVLDRFMADRLRSKVSLRVEPAIIPPWAHEAEIGASQDAAGFRTRHQLTARFVVMYSGNHTPSNPLTTVLEAAVRLRDDDRIRFVFVGGGMGKREVEDYRERYGLKNLLSLPYQPLAVLGDVLRTADLHVVSLGDAMVGIIHPSKVYGAMAAERPVLFLGPAPSHISELLDQHRFGWHVAHGDVAAAESLIRRLAAAPAAELAQSGGRGRAAIEHALSQRTLCDHLCSIVEHTFSLTPGREPRPLGTAPASVH